MSILQLNCGRDGTTNTRLFIYFINLFWKAFQNGSQGIWLRA